MAWVEVSTISELGRKMVSKLGQPEGFHQASDLPNRTLSSLVDKVAIESPDKTFAIISSRDPGTGCAKRTSKPIRELGPITESHMDQWIKHWNF
jgi:hypothetical protein